MIITLQHYLVLSVLVFTIGAIGVISRRSFIIMLMSIELMLSAAALATLAFARWNLLPDGKAVVIFIIAIVVAEISVGLSMAVAVYKKKRTILVDRMNLLRG